MKLTRVVLSIANCAVAAYAFYNFIKEMGDYNTPNWFAFGFGALMLLNALAFSFLRFDASMPGRLGRMVGLWMDAKELELKKRAGKT